MAEDILCGVSGGRGQPIVIGPPPRFAPCCEIDLERVGTSIERVIYTLLGQYTVGNRVDRPLSRSIESAGSRDVLAFLIDSGDRIVRRMVWGGHGWHA